MIKRTPAASTVPGRTGVWFMGISSPWQGYSTRVRATSYFARETHARTQRNGSSGRSVRRREQSSAGEATGPERPGIHDASVHLNAMNELTPCFQSGCEEGVISFRPLGGVGE